MESAKTFECSDDDFVIKGHDKAEIIKMAKIHILEKHGMNFTDEEIASSIRES